VRHDPSFGTGHRSRWRGLLAGFVPADYPDFGARSKHQLSFDSDPLPGALVVTGHPLLRVRTRGGPDFLLMAYLVDVDPEGRAAYVTEGQLRAWHRRETPPEAGFLPITPHHSFLRSDAAKAPADEWTELAIGLLPVSYAFRTRHRIRLVIALGDRDHFAALPGAAPEIAIMTAGEHGSSLTLTVEP
jgi:predicted acyl esterase